MSLKYPKKNKEFVAALPLVKALPLVNVRNSDKKKIRPRWFIFGLFLLLILLTFTGIFIQQSGIDVPIANNLAVLILLNINVILLLVLILIVSRNLIKLYIDRRSNVIGSRFQTKLVFSYVILTFVPSLLLYMIASGLLTSSIDKWFNVQIEKSLFESLEVAESYYKGSEENALFYANILSELITGRKMLDDQNIQYLKNVVIKKRAEYSVDSISIFGLDKQLIFETNELSIGKISENKNIQAIIEEAVDGNEISLLLPFNKQKYVLAVSPIRDFWDRKVIGVTLITKSISKDMVLKINNIAKGFKEYKELKELKFPVKVSYEITLLLITLLIVFAAIWCGFYFAKEITVPIQGLVEATHIISAGNLDYQIRVNARDEIKMLIESFNSMVSDLKNSKQEIEERNDELKRKNIELDGHGKYMETVLENIAAGVISIDRKGRLSTLNQAAIKIIDLKPNIPENVHYRKVFDKAYLDPIRKMIRDMKEIGRDSFKKQVQVTVSGRSMTLFIYINVLRKIDNEYLGMVVVFDDLTELLKTQKIAAWQEVAQGIAHEIKNPLTPIQLNTQRLRKKFKEKASDFDSVFDEATEVITMEVEGLKRLVNEFSKFARMPAPRPRPESIHEIINEVIALYKDNRKKVNIIRDFDFKINELNIDKEQIKRVFVNLIENSMDAMNNGNGIIQIKTCYSPMIEIVSVVVSDNGKGVQEKYLSKLFLPYFSKKRKGSGLGLAIVNRIIADHDGEIRVAKNSPSGTKFIITLPANS